MKPKVKARRPSRHRKRKPSFGEGHSHVTCRLCHREFLEITYSHLVRRHRLDPAHPIEEYKGRFGLKVAACKETIDRIKAHRWRYWGRLGRRWTRDRVRREIQALVRFSQPLHHSAVQKRRLDLTLAARRMYGSWEKALAACGLRYDRIRLIRAWSHEKVLEEIARRRRAGEAMNFRALLHRDPGMADAAIRLFGSWDGALRAAGIEPTSVRKQRPHWTPERVIATIRNLPRHALRYMTAMNDAGLVAAARQRFGTWKAAVEAAGFEYPRRWAPRKWTREKVMEEIKRRANSGRSVATGAVKREGGAGLYRAGRREFGGWKPAVRLAGVPYT